MRKSTKTRNARTDIRPNALVSFAGARALDKEASAEWGLNPFALVEAAGRACAEVFSRAFLRCPFSARHCPNIVALAGAGNNAADTLVMLRSLVLEGRIHSAACTVFISRLPQEEDGASVLASAVIAARMLGISVSAWDEEKAQGILADADFIIDGIAGTGLDSPLSNIPGARQAAFQMAEAVIALRAKRILRRNRKRPLIISVDIPSGIFDGWQPGMPAVAADATLAIELQKLCLYTPAARPLAGKILPVSGIFPAALTEKYREAEIVCWEEAARRIPLIPQTAYKYTRGLVEIRAGSPGATGAARLAALGTQAAGAGLVRLIVDPSLYHVIATASSGIMVVPDGCQTAEEDRFLPSAALLGPGWGKREDRKRLLEAYLPLEEEGLPLILDADAIAMAKGIVFHGNALLTPHPGEFAEYTGIPKETILANPVPILRRFAEEKKVHILLKSHVLYAASPGGQIGIIDGMNPLLAAGGSGDVLAGFCAAIAARTGNIYNSACAAASLLIKAAEAKSIAGCFADPAETANAAAFIAGKAWLPCI